MHEMGHHFGFGDQYLTDDLDCDYAGSIMSNTDFDDPERELSEDDKCMYMKLYCWSPVSNVATKEKTSVINIFPNPVNDYIVVQLAVDHFLQFSERIVLQIIDLVGLEIAKYELKYVNNRIDISNLPIGTYFIKVGDKVKKFVKM